MKEYIYLDENGEPRALEDIPKGTNIGVLFEIVSKTNDVFQDFQRTSIAKRMRHNPITGNIKVSFRKNLVYGVTEKFITKDSRLVLKEFPWTTKHYSKIIK